MSIIDALAPHLFVKEWTTDDALLWSEVDACIKRGWASATVGTARSGQSLISVAVKESCQERRRDLPIGARSLLFSQQEGTTAPQLVLRGVNKFSDYQVLEHTTLMRTMASLASMDATGVRCVLQKKLAGFVVLLFSLNGVELEVMSKHSLDGVHVQEARRILHATLSSERITQLAQHLHAACRVVLCECISPRWDYQHPILETCTPTLMVFAVVPRTSRLELCMPTDSMATFCDDYGLSCVPHRQIDLSLGTLQTQVEDVERSLLCWREASEGFVLVFEIPRPVVGGRPHGGNTVSVGTADTIVPLRLKLKSIRYRLLRCLRSTIIGEHSVGPTHEFYNHPYALILLHWARMCRHNAAEETVMEWVARQGIWHCSLAFEEALCRHKRLRIPSVVSDHSPLEELTTAVEQGAVRRRFSPHAMVMMCGLPGAGKSTICKELIATIREEGPAVYAAVVYLSRDAIAMEVERAAGIDAQSSGHQRRQVKKGVHQQLCDVIAHTARWMAHCMDEGQPVLLLLDACHASAAARHTFRSMMPPQMGGGCVCAHVHTGHDPTVAARRAAARDGHDILRKEDAMQAYLDVSRVFVAPQPDDVLFDTVLTVDSYARTARTNAQHLLDTLVHHPRPSTRAVRFLTHVDVLTLDAFPPTPLCADTLGFGVLSDLVNKHTGAACTARNTSQARLTPLDDVGCREQLLDVVVQSILHAGHGIDEVHTPERPPTGLLATAKHLLSYALNRSSLLSPVPQPDAVVALGHLRWVPGTFVRQDTTTPLRAHDAEALRAAILKRFELSGQDPHATLCYERGNDAVERVERCLSRHNLRVGQVVLVEATHVLMDPRAVCLLVRPVGTDVSALASSAHALHITLGHTHHVKPAYCGEMLAAFTAMEAENHGTQTKHTKQHNFVSVALHGSLRTQFKMHVEIK